MISQIKNDKINLAKKIEQYSIDQKDNWRKLPYLMLMSDGKYGYSPGQYKMGMFHLYSLDANGCCMYYVDCETGKFLYWNKFIDPNKDPIPFLKVNLDELNTEKHVEECIKRAKERFPDYNIEKKSDIKDWQQQTAKEYGITKIYTRKMKIPDPSWSD